MSKPKGGFGQWLDTRKQKVDRFLHRSRPPTPSRSSIQLDDSEPSSNKPSLEVNPQSSPPTLHVDEYKSISTNDDEAPTTAIVNTAPKGKRTWIVAIKGVLDVVERVSDIFPPLKTTLAGLNAVLEVADAFSSNQEEFEKLSERVTLLEKILGGCAEDDLPQEIGDRRDGLTRSIESLGRTLNEKTHRSGVKRAIYTKEDQEDIIVLVREMSFAIELAMLDVTVRNNTMILQAVKGINWLKDQTIEELQKISTDVSGIAKGVEVLNKAELFKRLGNVRNFGFTRGGRRNGCVPGSRITLLSQLLAWAEDPASGHVFWLSGIAGAGKTAVSETYCLELFNRGLLGASFFCSLTDQDLRDVYLIIPTLAKALALAHPSFGDELARIIETELVAGVNPLEMTLKEQYDAFVLRPAKLAFANRQQPVVLCVDALDECSDITALEEFLDVVLGEPPGPLKLFLTSRPEYAIKERMESPSPSYHRQSLRLHDIEHDVVRSDIELYVTRSLEKISALRRHYGDAWPPPEVQNIIERSGTLFIVAATIVRFIADTRGNQIARFMSCGSADAPAQSGVEACYHGILEKVFAELTEQEVRDLKACLVLLVVARRPLTVQEYAALLGRPEWVVREAFKTLYSVVEVTAGRPVSIYHASFIRFLTSKSPMLRAGQQVRELPWTVDVVEGHAMAAGFCVELMGSDDSKRGVYFGVSGAVTSYRSNEEQSLKLRSDLAYACTSWGDHTLRAMPVMDELEDKIRAFLEEKGLYWIEALGVEKQVGNRSTNVLWDIAKTIRDAGLKKLLLAIRDFCHLFGTPINYSAPHLYLSAIPFVEHALGPTDWRLPNFPSVPVVTHKTGRSVSDPTKLTIRHSEPVKYVDVSPDGTRIVSGGYEQVVKLWNTMSGECVTDVAIPDEIDAGLLSVAFARDGTRLLAGFTDGLARVWDGETWALLGSPTQPPLDIPALCVAISPDESRVATGTYDSTAWVWDVQGGEKGRRVLQGHTNFVASIAFSADGRRIVSGSADGTVIIWDAVNGKTLLGPLEGHGEEVTCVAFSPDGSRIASGARGGGEATVKLWDAEIGDLILDLAPLNWNVASLAFSPLGSKIAVASCFQITIWDAQNGSALINPLQGHSMEAIFLSWSPDESSIISGSHDKTIRVWDLRSTTQTAQVDSTRPSFFYGAFSPDGSCIAYKSQDTILVVDIPRGQAILEVSIRRDPGEMNVVIRSADESKRVSRPWVDKISRTWDTHNKKGCVLGLEVSSGGRRSVSISPDKSMLASGAYKEIDVWDTHTGQPTGVSPIKWYAGSIRNVVFSLDGKKLLAVSEYGTVRVWDVQSWKIIMDTSESDEDNVMSAAFSYDGSSFVVGCTDGKVRVWDLESGLPLPGSMEGHTGPVLFAAYSPDGSKIVSGGADNAVRVWDTQSGKPLAGPFVGHTAGVQSVEFSSDGTRILSRADDGILRVWNLAGGLVDVDASSESTVYLHDLPLGTVSLNDSGWLCNASGELLLWVPPRFRMSLRVPPLELVVGGPMTEVELMGVGCRGESWRMCMDPR